MVNVRVRCTGLPTKDETVKTIKKREKYDDSNVRLKPLKYIN